MLHAQNDQAYLNEYLDYIETGALGFGAIAFTTPERLQVLGEDMQHMR